MPLGSEDAKYRDAIPENRGIQKPMDGFGRSGMTVQPTGIVLFSAVTFLKSYVGNLP